MPTKPVELPASSKSRKLVKQRSLTAFPRTGSRVEGSKRRAVIIWPAWAFICSSAEALVEMLSTPDSHNMTDFGKNIFPCFHKSHKIHVHLFDGYWEDLGTIASYHESALALASDNPPFDFHAPEGVIFSASAIPAEPEYPMPS